MQSKFSVQNKLTYSIVFFAVLSLLIIGYLGYSNTKTVYIEKIRTTEQSDIEDIVSSIQLKLAVMKHDANFIANFYAMQKLLNWQRINVGKKIDRWDKATKDTFKSLIDLKKFYYKLRVLDLQGKEKISVFYNQQTQQPIVQNNEKLQNRSKEDYFKKAVNLKPGEIHVSQMELNVEFGKILYPHVPIVHFSATIYDNNGDKRGVAVINAYANNLMAAMQTQKNSHDNIKKNRYMIDQNGYFFYHKNKDKTWGEQLEHGENFKQYYPQVFEVISNNDDGLYEYEGKLFSYKRIYPDTGNKKEYWVVISEVEKQAVFTQLQQFERFFKVVFL